FRKMAVLLALFDSFVMVEAEVQDNYSPECCECMYMGTTPLGLEDKSLKKICQRYNGKPRFVTLYDTLGHIPVYSMYEPQLSTVSDFGEMQPFPQGDLHRSFEDAQAVLEDYTNTVNLERGHLNPDEHQSDPNEKAATYTLTNVVPQVREFNIGPWKTHEHTIRHRLNNYCRGTAFVVTGVTTSGNMIRRHNIDRVAERSKLPAYATHGLNEKERPEVVEISVQQLDNFLKSVTFVDKTFQIFYDNCVPPDNGLHMP
uniref:Zgc:172339 n=1 Tax=Salmo trutta TaxID=8032 RepID=A0A673XNM5_SALTR